MPDTKYVLAIDQGTTSSRAIVFDHAGQIVATGQNEHEQIFPRAGWVEHDAEEIWDEHPRGRRPRADPGQPHRTATSPRSASPTSARPRSSGTAPPASRSTTRSSGRTPARRRSATSSAALGGGADRYKAKVGLPLATYFSGPKVRWILDNVEGAREQGRGRRPGVRQHRHVGAVEHDRRGRRRRARHRRDQRLAHHADGPRHAHVGRGDRRATWASRCRCCPRSARRPRSTATAARAAWSRACRSPASSATSRPRRSARRASRSATAKNTYGTGNFMLLNTGTEPVPSKNGLLTTVCYKIGDQPTGVRARGLDRRDRLARPVAARQPRHHLVGPGDRGRWPTTVEDNGGAYFVPAFSGPVRAVLARPTPAARSSASPGTSTRGTSPGPRWRPRPSRPARCSTR